MTQSGCVFHFRLTTMVRWKCFVPQLYQVRMGILGGPALKYFHMIYRGWRSTHQERHAKSHKREDMQQITKEKLPEIISCSTEQHLEIFQFCWHLRHDNFVYEIISTTLFTKDVLKQFFFLTARYEKRHAMEIGIFRAITCTFKV